MTQEEKSICPACGKIVKVGVNFCKNCGVELSEFNMTVTTSRTTAKFPIKGWEVSADRIDKFQKMIAMYPIGDPIIISKCVLGSDNGLLIVSDNGIAWRYKMSFGTSEFGPVYKSVWIRWHDVAGIILKKPSQVIVEMKRRKKGSLKLDKRGHYKLIKLKLTIRENKGEKKQQFKQRLESFNSLMLEIFNQNRVEVDPPMSDSQLK